MNKEKYILDLTHEELEEQREANKRKEEMKNPKKRIKKYI